MSDTYTCPVCNKLLKTVCEHYIGKYAVYVYFTGTVSVWDDDGNRLFRLTNPKRLDEEYIDKLVLLK
jgi:hypothetical protein